METNKESQDLNFYLAPAPQEEKHKAERRSLFLESAGFNRRTDTSQGYEAERLNSFQKAETRELKALMELGNRPIRVNSFNRRDRNLDSTNYYARRDLVGDIIGGAEFIAFFPIATACALDLATHNHRFTLTRATIKSYGKFIGFGARTVVKAAPPAIELGKKGLESIKKRIKK